MKKAFSYLENLPGIRILSDAILEVEYEPNRKNYFLLQKVNVQELDPQISFSPSEIRLITICPFCKDDIEICYKINMPPGVSILEKGFSLTILETRAQKCSHLIEPEEPKVRAILSEDLTISIEFKERPKLIFMKKP